MGSDFPKGPGSPPGDHGHSCPFLPIFPLVAVAKVGIGTRGNLTQRSRTRAKVHVAQEVFKKRTATAPYNRVEATERIKGSHQNLQTEKCVVTYYAFCALEVDARTGRSRILNADT